MPSQVPQKLHKKGEKAVTSVDLPNMMGMRTSAGLAEEKVKLVPGAGGMVVCTFSDGQVFQSDVPNLMLAYHGKAKTKANAKAMAKAKKEMRRKERRRAKAKAKAKSSRSRNKKEAGDEEDEGDEGEAFVDLNKGSRSRCPS